MPADRRLLLGLLGASVLLCAAGLGGARGFERLRELRSLAGSYRQQVEKLLAEPLEPGAWQERRAELAGRIAGEQARFYQEGEMDLYRFGIEVGRSLQRHGITVQRCITVEDRAAPLLEYSFNGDILAFTRFLQEVSAAPRYWVVPFLSIKKQKDSVDGVFRIGYAQVPARDR